MDQMLLHIKIEWSRPEKTCVGLEDASCAISGGLGLQKLAVDLPGSLATTCLPRGWGGL